MDKAVLGGPGRTGLSLAHTGVAGRAPHFGHGDIAARVRFLWARSAWRAALHLAVFVLAGIDRMTGGHLAKLDGLLTDWDGHGDLVWRDAGEEFCGLVTEATDRRIDTGGTGWRLMDKPGGLVSTDATRTWAPLAWGRTSRSSTC